MGLVSKPKSWVDDENVLYTDLNNDFDTHYNEFNGNIDNANIKSGAGIVETKLAFSGSGHGHTGGSDGKLISIGRAFVWYSASTQAIATNSGPRYVAPQAMTIRKVWLTARTAPTGADIIIDINKNGTTIWTTQANRGKVLSGATTGNTATFDVTTLAAGDYLDFDVDQVGSSVAGSDLTVVLEVTQP